MLTNIIREELAWAAGFFDGEGTVLCAQSSPKSKRSPQLRVQVANTYLETIVRFAKATNNLGQVYEIARDNRKLLYAYRTNSFQGAQATIAMLWTFLSNEKRVQAQDAIEVYHIRWKARPRIAVRIHNQQNLMRIEAAIGK